MRKNFQGMILLVAMLLASVALAASAEKDGTWISRVPEKARLRQNPLASDPNAVAAGGKLYRQNCAKCHGPEGKGDGPDSDHAADLTDEFRADLNPEGVLYYKIWNGHTTDMPAFKSKLTKDEVWSLVEYLKTLRTPAKP